jgi:hypothetical protein
MNAREYVIKDLMGMESPIKREWWNKGFGRGPCGAGFTASYTGGFYSIDVWAEDGNYAGGSDSKSDLTLDEAVNLIQHWCSHLWK